MWIWNSEIIYTLRLSEDISKYTVDKVISGYHKNQDEETEKARMNHIFEQELKTAI